MCTVSNIMDYGQTHFPGDWWSNPNNFEEFKRLLEQAKQFDKITGELDCEDPLKKKALEDLINNKIKSDKLFEPQTEDVKPEGIKPRLDKAIQSINELQKLIDLLSERIKELETKVG